MRISNLSHFYLPPMPRPAPMSKSIEEKASDFLLPVGLEAGGMRAGDGDEEAVVVAAIDGDKTLVGAPMPCVAAAVAASVAVAELLFIGAPVAPPRRDDDEPPPGERERPARPASGSPAGAINVFFSPPECLSLLYFVTGRSLSSSSFFFFSVLLTQRQALLPLLLRPHPHLRCRRRPSPEPRPSCTPSRCSPASSLCSPAQSPGPPRSPRCSSSRRPRWPRAAPAPRAAGTRPRRPRRATARRRPRGACACRRGRGSRPARRRRSRPGGGGVGVGGGGAPALRFFSPLRCSLLVAAVVAFAEALPERDDGGPGAGDLRELGQEPCALGLQGGLDAAVGGVGGVELPDGVVGGAAFRRGEVREEREHKKRTKRLREVRKKEKNSRGSSFLPFPPPPSPSPSLALSLSLISSLTFQELADVLDKLCARQARSPLLLLGRLLSFGCGSRSHVLV